DDDEFRVDGTQVVGGVLRLLCLAGFRVAQHVRIQVAGTSLHFGGTANDGDRLAAPLDRGDAVRFDLADSHYHGGAGGTRTRARLHGSHERHGGSHDADTSDHGGGDRQEMAPGEVYAVSTHPKLS